MVKRVNTRRLGWRLGAVAVASTMLLAACSSSPTEEQTDDSPEPASGGDLVIGVTSDPDTLFPWKATQFQAMNVVELLYGTLTEFDADLSVVPGLAESWELSEDALTLTLTLREGVTFSDGSEFDSADAKASLEAIMLEETGAVAASSLASVSGIEAPDASTVLLTLSGPDAAILAGLASPNLAMLSSEDTEASVSTTPNGTGPFTLADRTPNESLVLASNQAYWHGAPPLDTVEFRVIPDETSIVSALQSGNVQLAVFNDPLVARTAGGSGIEITETNQLSYHALQLNATRPPLDDLNVRLAIQCAIDRQEVLDSAALGEGEITGPITSPAYRSDPASRPCPERDLDAAKEYLAAAGLADGVAFSAIVSQGEYATSVNEAQSVQAQLAEAGITMEIETLESGAYVDRWIAADFDGAIALNGGRPDPDTMYVRYFTSTGNLNQVAGYSSDTLDQLFAAGKVSADPAERQEIYQQVSDELEANAVWIWMFTGYNYTAVAAEVTGYTPMANNSVQSLRETTLS